MKSKNTSNNAVEILIAEDSPTQAEQLRYLLEGHGCKVVAADNGRKALEAIRQRRPSLVISDIVMPEMNGYELCKAIKSDDAVKDIPVILVTTLSDVLDIMKGLECGADNFIRKPYDEKYLLARVDYLLMNQEMRKGQKMQMGMEIHLGGQRHFITAERQQIVDLLISVYEEAVHLNEELKARQNELADSNRALTGLYHVAEGLNRAVNEREVCEKALEHALELPGVRAGWISLSEGESGFRLGAARNLPPALLAPGAMEGLCECRRRLLAGELDHVTNILECERLGKAKDDTQGLRYHASVPLWNGDQILGVMNLVGTEQGLFREDELETLYGVGHQVGIALERARLHEHLEQLVEERTAALTAEIAERQRIQEEQARLVAIIEATSDLVATASPDDRIFYCNRAGFQMLGVEKMDDLATQRIKDCYPPWAARLVLEEAIPQAISHGTWSGETAVLRRDGREIPVLQVIIAHKDPDGSVQYLSTIARDITERKANEAKIKRLNRIYSVLSGINTTIVRVRKEEELFDEACRIAVAFGKFTFAWLGKLDPATQQITPLARAGLDDGYLAQINLSACEEVPGSCVLTARALTEAKPMICNDVASDARMAAWRDEALHRGYRSLAVFPLILESKPVGVFVLYATETNVFDDEEMALLTEMAGDISFAMDNLKKEAKLDYLAYYDAVTGLPNRALFYDRLGQHLHDAKGNDTMAVLAIDLERFRVINETFGRHLGDALLRQVAERLIATGVGVDHLARISADCFAVVLLHTREEADIVRFLKGQIAAALGEPFRLEDKELRISAKAGIALFPGDGKDADTLFRNAEAALKRTKLCGDKYLFYSPEFNARVAEKLMLENKLRTALELGQFVLHYQPKVSLKDGHICSMEALIRWNDPETGLVPPAKFISVLEETGMITEVGSWALEQAMADYRELRDNNFFPPRIAVNVSQVQLQRSDFVSMIERVVSGSGGVPGGLEIEITENLVMQDIEVNIEKLHAIRKMGVEVAIDDFGTGYSSLSYIAKLPINSLKIDRAFIINMTLNADDLSIVSAIISLAHTLNLRVVAEGVETDEQAKILRLLKCDEIQGFLFSPGVPIAQIRKLLREKNPLPM
jgi:diguanylate cyclase (GGDEF)-like protein/PAS domain S-box-containing protein